MTAFWQLGRPTDTPTPSILGSQGEIPFLQRSTHLAHGRPTSRRRLCTAAEHDRNHHHNSKSTDAKEAEWLFHDNDFEELHPEEEAGDRFDVEDNEDDPSTSGRLPIFRNNSVASQEDLQDDKESQEFAAAMAKVGWETKAEDIRVLHVAPLVYWCSYMVLLNIKSRPQLQAVIAKMEKIAEERFKRTLSPTAETSRGSEWEVLDYFDVVVHIFTEKQRTFYDLDGYYGMAEAVDLPFLREDQLNVTWAKSIQ